MFLNAPNHNLPQLRRLGVWAIVVVVGSVIASHDGQAEPTKPADKSANSKQPAQKSAPRNKTYPIAAVSTPEEREAEAIEFAVANHPELAKLVSKLKKVAPAEYKNAVRDLFWNAHRINRMQRDPERHDLELQVWKTESRARLFAARMAGSSDPTTRRDAETKLRSTLQQLTAAKLAKLKFEQKRIAKRLESLENSIEEIEANPTAAAEREFNRLRRSLSPKSKNTPRKKPSKNAVKTVSVKTDSSSN